jgi:cell wall-associated NlpC family hydrolase
MLSSFSIPVTSQQKAAIRQFAEKAFPLEACGFILTDGTVVECKNTSTEPDTFVISAAETAQYLDDAISSWHSHCDYAGVSFADVNASKALNLPYVIWNCAGSELFYYDPSQSTGLLGRPWIYGGYDCYSALRDWYSQQMGIELRDYERLYEGEWSQRGFTHFEDNFAAEGFVQISKASDLQRGDMLMFRIQNRHTCNHVAVVEDPVANKIYQHLVGQESRVMSYSRYFRDNTYMIVRQGS